ncbi:hypothetical protein GCM10025760_34320 [Microbacterium yannicii]|uniref:Uncharacterized protein n=1 Tax=Microbacterium yannicii TaxID=671622 RepID=A0ABP9MNC3_9MICO|nr:hypothetical protein [Microbacterium yannicii]
MSERDPSRRLAAARARAEAVTAQRLAADRAAARAARVADVRAGLALAADRAAAVARPPRDPIAERAAAIRAEMARAARLAPWASDMARERERLAADLLAATPDHHDAYDWEMTHA